ncbi:MAG: porin [Verrucomicrobiales bacterium]|nr:porin [Verrucomicrobiales bacterium]
MKEQWTKIIGGALGSALLVSTGLADGGAPAPSAKDLSKAVEKVNYVETDTAGVKLSGYVDVGYIYNFIGKGSYAMSRGYNASDSHSGGDFNVNAVKFTLEKSLTEKNEWQAGFRVDTFVGKDWAEFVPGAGSDASTLFLQQAYVEFRVPVGNGLDVQFGKMGSILGFEADERPANLNITQGLNATIDPGPSPGVLATYHVTDSVDVMLGVNNGGGLDNNPGLDTSGDGYGFTGGVNFHHDNFETQLTGCIEPWGNEAYTSDNVTVYGVNWWTTWSPKFAADHLLLAFNASYWYAKNLDPSVTDYPGSFATAALYAKYQFTDLFSLAGRGEYVNANDGETNNYWSFTLTAGFNVAENLLLRAEYRYDTGKDVVYNYDTETGNHSGHTVALEAVYTF